MEPRVAENPRTMLVEGFPLQTRALAHGQRRNVAELPNPATRRNTRRRNTVRWEDWGKLNSAGTEYRRGTKTSHQP
eukprot:11199309-Lingulodinium_polyedra.AAC.1